MDLIVRVVEIALFSIMKRTPHDISRYVADELHEPRRRLQSNQQYLWISTMKGYIVYVL